MLKTFYVSSLSVLLFLSVSINCFAQVKYDYTTQWKKTDDLISKGLTKSALEEVNKIYQAAKKEGNDAQVIKSLIYQLDLTEKIQEEASVKNIVTLEKEIAATKQPAKSILQAILAKLYLSIFLESRWRIYNRTKTENFVKTDVHTWGTDDFHKKISELCLASIQEEKLLQNTKLDQFDPFLVKGNVRYLRPTLYDLLAHEALQYFKSDEMDISRPSYVFQINDGKAFAPAEEFIRHLFISKDSASLHYKALVIFQKLLAFHAGDAKPDALIDVDVSRIEFVKQYGVMQHKDSLYLAVLENLAAAYSGSPASAQAGYLAAQHIFSKASEERTGIDSSHYTIRQAKELADSVVKKFPASEGGINARNLLIQILHKELTLISEKVNVPGKPFRTLVTYKNISSINLRLISLAPDFNQHNVLNDEDGFWKRLTGEKSIRAWKQALPATDDYKSHSAEIKVDALPVGHYALLCSGAEDFSLNKNPLAVQYLHISNISYINNGMEYFALHRESGKPLGNARVQVWEQVFDSKSGIYNFEKKKSVTADKNGYFTISDKAKGRDGKIHYEYSNLRLEITYQSDRLFLDDYQNTYRYYNDEDNNEDEYTDQNKYDREKARIYLFTDRSIYRPGQLVYFKGIGVTRDIKTKRTRLLEYKDTITVLLKDANYEDSDSLQVVLNEYGSFSGKFRLPENKLNGEFRISAQYFKESTVSFSVEEYKRPKFYTELEKAKGTYRVNDTITITGFAKAYAGNNIDGATVKYRVTRVARFLYPWLFWRWPMPQTNPLEITHGEITTGNDGKFSVAFEAIPDLTIDRRTEPVFDYKIEADVTDINGETRSASLTVPAGYKSLELQITFSQNEAINIDSLKYITVTSKNLSGEFEATRAEVKIYKLEEPKRLIRTRYWTQPDRFIMTKEEFLKYFPNDEYGDENKKETWARTRILFSKTDSTSAAGSWQLENAGFTPGWYVAEAIAKDKYGQEVKDVKYFQLYDVKAATLPAAAYFWSAPVKATAEPGEKAVFISGTSAGDIFLIQHIDKSSADSLSDGDRQVKSSSDRPGLTSKYQFGNLSDGDRQTKLFEFPITENDRGGFGIYQFFVKDNRAYATTYNINVPWTNKQLDITYATFRDKTLPGSEEKWKVKIAGRKGDKIAAEMLAGMYDASLDQFRTHNWEVPDVWPTHFIYNGWASAQNFASVQSRGKWLNERYVREKEKRYDGLLYSYNDNSGIRIRGGYMKLAARAPGLEVEMAAQSAANEVAFTYSDISEAKKVQTIQFTPPKAVKDEEVVTPPDNSDSQAKSSIAQSQIQIRKNFNETAFFFPDLKTDKDGNIEFSFTMPEALTQWKLMTLAHTKELELGYTEKTVITQKELMVQPNAPRFVREGDSMQFSAKVVNLGTKQITGQAQLQLFNAATMAPVDDWFKNAIPQKSFTIAAGQSAAVKFNIIIPANYNNALVYRIIAKASAEGNSVSDGEEAAIPVLTNRMLVTETLPLPVRGNETKAFTFEKLLGSGNSKTLSNHGLTVEFTTNPAWYAVQALPYLMEYPYDCAEQTFNRYYANSIASMIVSASPKIKGVFEKWKTADTSALLSNLQKNEELKSVLLAETPWVLQAQNESLQKKNIALLFDMVLMSKELASSLAKLKDAQSPGGGFPWFRGGPDDRYITQYIVTGIGRLKKLSAISKQDEQDMRSILQKAIPYLDRKLKEDYDNLKKYKYGKANNVSPVSIQYLYMRSFFPEYAVAPANQAAYNYYLGQVKKNWLAQGKYMQAMIALSLYRSADKTTPQAIIRSLKENSLHSDELGMYWKEFNNYSYWWYHAPIESQALMIEAFSEIDKDMKVTDNLKTWLLKNKQSNNWHTTKATADACYALLLQGTNWLSEEKEVAIKLGSTIINSSNERTEEGTGYFKHTIDGSQVTPEMGNISVQVSHKESGQPSSSASWGAVYWKYFEDLDKITFAETPLKLTKKLFIERNTDRGPVLSPFSFGEGAGGEAKVGDKIKVRIELRVDRDMEYVHMKDMRAAGMEPINVISQYKYQDGLGYYESTKDASTNFFFHYLRKGTYVFEYPLFVTHSGNFSNGVTTIQCMYAPEFTAHSEGVRLQVKE